MSEEAPVKSEHAPLVNVIDKEPDVVPFVGSGQNVWNPVSGFIIDEQEAADRGSHSNGGLRVQEDLRNKTKEDLYAMYERMSMNGIGELTFKDFCAPSKLATEGKSSNPKASTFNSSTEVGQQGVGARRFSTGSRVGSKMGGDGSHFRQQPGTKGYNTAAAAISPSKRSNSVGGQASPSTRSNSVGGHASPLRSNSVGIIHGSSKSNSVGNHGSITQFPSTSSPMRSQTGTRIIAMRADPSPRRSSSGNRTDSSSCSRTPPRSPTKAHSGNKQRPRTPTRTPERTPAREKPPGVPNKYRCCMCKCLVLLFSQRCLVCSRTYCRDCSKKGMRKSESGHKCKACANRGPRRFSHP